MHDALGPLDGGLVRDGLEPVLQIVADVAVLAGADDDPRRGFEQVVHFLERAAGRLGEQGPEEQRVGEVADDEEVVEPIADVGHCDGCGLALLEEREKNG